MWLSAASKAEADDLRRRELARLAKGIIRTEQTVGEYVMAWLDTVDVGPGTRGAPTRQSCVIDVV
jgi:hypothetical protein